MFWWIFNAILSSLSGTFWKKSLGFSGIPDRLFYAIGMIGSLIVASIVVGAWKFEIPSLLWILCIPFADAFIVIFNSQLQQRIYRTEKVSALMPYENISSILTIIAAFFLFRDTSVITLLIAVATIGVIFLFSFDFKKREFPKSILLVFLSNTITAGRSLVIWYALSHQILSNSTFYVLRNVTSAFLVWSIVLYFGQQKGMFSFPKTFYSTRLTASFLGAISAFLGFFLLSKLGITVATLLGFLSMITTLTFNYFILKDIPERRGVILSVIVTVLVAIGTYFRV